MTGDNMSAEFITDLERALQIDTSAPAPTADRRHAQRLGGGFDGKPPRGDLPTAHPTSQANANAGDRGAGADAVPIIAAQDREAGKSLSVRCGRCDEAGVSDDAAEHVARARSLAMYAP